MSRGILATLTMLLMTINASAGEPAGNKELEKAITALNQAFEDADAGTLERLMTPDHVAVTPYYGAPFTRAEQLKTLADLKLTEYKAGKIQIKLLSKNVALITYPVTLKGTFRGTQVPARCFATAVWVKRDNGAWLETFYQETTLKGE